MTRDSVRSKEEGEKIIRFLRVMSAAVEYFGSKTKAKEWLDKPSRALSYKKPSELISSESGAQTVLNLIGHMSYGVYS